jgi:hypothetical protein
MPLMILNHLQNIGRRRAARSHTVCKTFGKFACPFAIKGLRLP